MASCSRRRSRVRASNQTLFLRTVPDALCRGKRTVGESSQEVKFMAVTYAEPLAEKCLDLETGPFGAKLTAGEVAKLLKVHLIDRL
jgi:hypothetical protein